MTRRLSLALAASALIALPATADAAAKKTSKAPVVKKVTPRSAKVGDTLVLTGKNFVRGKGKNVVLFYTTKGGATFTKALDASATRLKVTVPDKLAALLPANGDEARILLRVRGKRLGTRTSTRIAPLISINPDDVGGDNSGTGGSGNPVACTPNPSDPLSDIDKDLLSDALERTLMLDACNRDSDGDGASDGYEYYSAIDQNSLPSEARPYPWKTPYPNPLFKDADIDHDGDGLTLKDEYDLWAKFGQNQPPPPSPLWYSAGKQSSAEGATDDVRDADEDGLGNWDESHGRMTAEWWKAKYDGTNDVLETPYPVTFGPVSMLEKDSDGDKVPDGEDDTDFDGLSNSVEVHRPGNWHSTYVSLAHNFNFTILPTGHADFDPTDPDVDSGYRYYARVNPFNPCKPVQSDKCHLHPPFGYYDASEDWVNLGAPGTGKGPEAPPLPPGAGPDADIY